MIMVFQFASNDKKHTMIFNDRLAAAVKDPSLISKVRDWSVVNLLLLLDLSGPAEVASIAFRPRS